MAIGVKAVYVSYVAHVLGLVGAILVLVWSISFRGGLAWEATNKNLIFNIHPVLMLIGFIIIGGQAIMSYKILPLKKPEKKLIHLVLHAIALVLGIIGIYTAFKFHNESNIHTFKEIPLHFVEESGGGNMCERKGGEYFQTLKWLYGFVIFFYPGGTPPLRKESLPWHVLFGIFVYILAVGTAALGYLEKLTFLENSGIAKYGSEAFLVNFTAIVTILYGSFVIFTILSKAPPEDEYGHGYRAIEHE